MTEYWFALFNESTTSNGSNLISPLDYKIVREYFGDEVLKIFVSWFVNRRKQINIQFDTDEPIIFY